MECMCRVLRVLSTTGTSCSVEIQCVVSFSAQRCHQHSSSAVGFVIGPMTNVPSEEPDIARRISLSPSSRGDSPNLPVSDLDLPPSSQSDSPAL